MLDGDIAVDESSHGIMACKGAPFKVDQNVARYNLSKIRFPEILSFEIRN